MKTLFSVLTLLLFHGTANASIAPPPSLAVTDQRCSLSLGNSTIDYGNQTKAQLQSVGGLLTPGKRTLMLNVVCPYAREIKLRIQGEGAMNSDLRYGDHGRLQLQLVDAQLDGQRVSIRDISNGVVTEQWSLPLKAGTRFEVSHNGLPLNGKNFSAKLELQPLLSNSAANVSYQTTSEARFSVELFD